MGIQWNKARVIFRVFCIIALIVLAVAHLLRNRKPKLKPESMPEMGYRSTPGFQEFMEVDRLITTRAGRQIFGNTPQGRDLARELERLIEKDPGYGALSKPAIYVLIHGKYCIFVIDSAQFDRFDSEFQFEAAKALWPHAQALARKSIKGFPTVGLGLRGQGNYGPIMIGGRTGDPIYSQHGGRYLLYPYFAKEPSLRHAVAVKQDSSPKSPGKTE